MLTIKHVNELGESVIFEAISLYSQPVDCNNGSEKVSFCPPNAQVMEPINGQGVIYVMNEVGKTISRHELYSPDLMPKDCT